MIRTLSLLALFAASPALADAPAPKVQPEVQLKHAAVKVVKITIAPGAALPVHTTPVHATVAAMAGEGSVSIGEKTVALPTHGTVFLPKTIPHGVKNTGTTPLVLLVHHLKGT